MKTNPAKFISRLLLPVLFASNVHGAITSISSAPLVTSSASSVLPNLVFVLDDSGSMDWNYMPDWASGATTALARNARYNGVAYDPAVTYLPPVWYAADGSLDTTTYPSQTGTSAASGANTGVSMPNWKNVKNDAYGVQSTGTSDLTSDAYYYSFLPGEYCTDDHQKTCAAGTAPSATYPKTAYLRWCDSSAQTNNGTPSASSPKGCQAVWTSGEFNNPRYPGLFTGTRSTSSFTIATAASNPTVTSIKANGLEILSGTTAGSNTQSTVAQNIVDKINACTNFAVGNCQVAGYSATRSTATVTITAPTTIDSTAVNANGYSLTMAFTNTLTTSSPAKSGASPYTMTAFAGYTLGAGKVNVPGRNVRVDIVSTNDSYPYPGSATKASTRTDCAGSTCTYSEEMTNYANWFTYYRTRMQMMKTSTSIAFKPVGATYRVGYFSINNNTGSDFLNIADFDGTQKRSWYMKLFAANPSNSTPLHPALTRAGRLYAGKLNGTSFNGSTVVDPMQYSCQQNFTILSTDGYWNSGSGYQLNGTTTVGQQDGAEVRPYVDSSIVTDTTVTPYTKVDRKSTDTPVTITTPYTRTVTTVSATPNCGGYPTACLQDNGSNSASSTRTWCITTSESGYECNRLDSGGSSAIYACRGGSNATNTPSGGSACKTDTDNGKVYCIYVGNSQPNTSSCERVRSGNSLYGCVSSASSTGYTVSVQTQTASRTVTGTNTSVDDYTSSYDSTVVTTNGVSAPATNSAVTVTVANVTPASFTPTAPSDDTGVPADGAYVNSGSPVVSCSATPPAAGTSAGGAGTQVTTSGTPVETVLSAGTYAAGTPTTTSTGSGGTPNTLADVSQYYYKTDLRTSALGNCTGTPVPPAVTGADVCTNDVPSTGEDAASWQHMTTFTLGLGASGYMQYSPSYASATSTTNDFYAVKSGATANSVAGVCTWQADGTTCNWPTPVSNTMSTIDDLWHTAVNGRGAYFSATNPSSLSAGLSGALSGVSARIGSSAAATTSNPNVTSGDNFVFSSTFSTQSWDGELVRQQIDLTTGVVSSTIDWAAQAKLDAKPYASRTIYTYDAGAANRLKAFTYGSLTTTEQSYFNVPNISGLSQFCSAGATCLDASAQTAAAGTPLVNFLRGDRSNEGVASDTSKYFRQRSHVLGDIVTAEAVYVKKSLFQYTDRGYLTTPQGTSYTPFVTANSKRRGMVYVASNDGMLHAFYAASAPCTTLPNPSASPPVSAVPADCDPDITTGTAVAGGDEAWAYVPKLVMSNLYKLADKNYANQHSYFVDGTPVVADICTANCNATPTVVENGETQSYVISSATWSGGVVTIVTNEATNYTVGTSVVINGVASSGYNGTFTITSKPTPTSFTYTLATDPGAHPDPIWKTILVGGLNAGGRGYYALDITDPLAPKALWEFTDTNLGYTFGNPEIAKLKDGTWVVMVTSGYNNLSPGDGVGRLYVLNAETGALIRTISTGVGSPAVSVSNVSWSAGVATVTTTAAHGFSVGSSASVIGVSPDGYNGTYTVTAVPSATQFRYSLTSDPFTAMSGRLNPRAVSGASWSGGTVTIDTATTHGLSVGSVITVSGFDNANTGYNGTYTVTAVPSTTRLQYALASDPGGWASTGSEAVSRAASISSSWSGGSVTVTTSSAHGLSVGNSVTLAGFSPAGYNGTVVVTSVPTTTSFTYALASNPGTTGAVAGGTPSGLGRIRAWVDNATNDNTALRVYGGDMLGNVWRFDINGDIGAAGYDAHRLVTLYTSAASTTTQPITARPELGEISVGNARYPVVFVGTGRYLGTPDLTDTSQQTMYAIKDNLDENTLDNPRLASANFVQQVQTNTLCPSGTPTNICKAGESVRTTTNNAVDFATNNGWYVDFPDSGERDNTDPVLQLGTLVFNTNVPNVSVCTAGGYSYTWFLDYRTGGAVSSSTTKVSARRLGSALATRPTVVRLPNNTVVALTRLSDSSTTTSDVAIGSAAGTTRRVSWRELISE